MYKITSWRGSTCLPTPEILQNNSKNWSQKWSFKCPESRSPVFHSSKNHPSWSALLKDFIKDYVMFVFPLTFGPSRAVCGYCFWKELGAQGWRKNWSAWMIAHMLQRCQNLSRHEGDFSRNGSEKWSCAVGGLQSCTICKSIEPGHNRPQYVVK